MGARAIIQYTGTAQSGSGGTTGSDCQACERQPVNGRAPPSRPFDLRPRFDIRYRSSMTLLRITAVGARGPHPGRLPCCRFSPVQRACACALLLAFLLATVVTTAASLGAYCLTTDSGDTRALPDRFWPPPLQPVRR
ncbi:MAG: hypothetical protein ACE5I7_04090 [Candidatus Binatia bacterium]